MIFEQISNIFLSDEIFSHKPPFFEPGTIIIVYLELKRRKFHVYIGKVGNKEIDFIAERENKKVYIQVCYLLESQKTIEREFSSLLMIKDNYPKYVISMDTYFGNDYKGIIRMNLIDFLLEKDL